MEQPPVRYLFGEFELDPVDKALSHHGHPVSLTPKAFDTLLVLVQRHGRLVTKEELLRQVWPGTFVEENNLAQNISAIRRALGEGTTDRFIETVPKRGYRFVGTVREALASDDSRAPSFSLETGASSNDASRVVQTVPLGDVPAPPHRVRTQLWALAAVAALIFAAAALPTWWRRAGASSTANASIARPDAASEVTRIAVLPMTNLGSPADASFVAGLTEELTSRLAGLRRVTVPSSTTLAAYDRRGKTLAEIGKDLRVHYVVEGSVRWSHDAGVTRVRLNPRLVRVADDTTVWTHQYDALLSDLFSVQAEIASRIAEASQLALDSHELQTVATKPTRDVDAYVAYLRGMALFRQGNSDTANIAGARAELEQAVTRDPDLAEAWSWLARTYAAQYRTGAERTPEVMAMGLRAAQRAIELAPDRADLRLGRIEMVGLTGSETAVAELEALRQALPNSSEVLDRVAMVARVRGHWRESEAALLRAFELDPASRAEQLAVHYLHLRQYDDARRYTSVAHATNHVGVTVPDAWTSFSDRGDLTTARRVLDVALRTRATPDSRVLALLARLEWFAGNDARALELVGRMDAAGSWLAPNFRFPAALMAAQIHDSQGRREEARRLYAQVRTEMERRKGGLPPARFDIVMAQALAGLDQHQAALLHARRAVETMGALGDAAELPLHLYFKAIVHTRVGDLDGAFATLGQMFSTPGFYSDQWIRHDPSFAALRRHEDFNGAVGRWARQRGLDRLEAGVSTDNRPAHDAPRRAHTAPATSGTKPEPGAVASPFSGAPTLGANRQR